VDPSSIEEPPEDEPEKREPIEGGVVGGPKSPSGLRKTIAVGPVMVLGVASWAPAVGAVLSGSLRPKEYASFGLEARAAWLTTGVGGEAISAMTAGGVISGCLHHRWIFGCALAHLGIMRGAFSENIYRGGATFTNFKPGAGARAGVYVKPAGSLVLQGSLDILGLSSGTKVFVGQTLLVDQPPVFIGAQFTGGWEF